ncbi:SRPBCC domain-containing protein [Limibacter armeniacum]|uniref:SRPBCC family protein n=1 Tax=Limibacter armeniacum TaxID=466084 RepID=UPI002FE682D7
MKDEAQPITVKQTFKAPIKTVWKAITEVEQMRLWFFEDIKAFEPEVGFETQFDVAVEDKVFPHLWKIMEVVPEQKITYNWKYKGFKGDSWVTFELSEFDSGTQVLLTHIGMESFPQEIPEFSRESCQGGWEYFIQQQLKAYLNQKA